jgi:hypothetical protein
MEEEVMAATIKGKRNVTEIVITENGYAGIYDLKTNQPVAGFQIQNGPILAGVNGVQVEDIVLIALNRIEAAQATAPSDANLAAIDALKAAVAAINMECGA